jgi:hypothetical protein
MVSVWIKYLIIVYHERNEESNVRLDEVVHVGLLHDRILPPVYVT